jgi:hypothetical protein
MCFSVKRSNQSAGRRSKSVERRSRFGLMEWGWLPADSSGKEEQI